MQKNNESHYDFNDSISEPFNDIRTPKNYKIKMLRDLNKASNLNRSDKNVKLTNSKQKDPMVNKQRSRNNSSTHDMDSMYDKVLPGAKLRRGQWKDNKLHGEVLIEYDNGNIFEGKYQNNLRIEGKMIYKEANCEYEGSFFAQKFSGYGKLTHYNGRVIQGEWDATGIVGNCTITYPNEDVYYGPVDEKLYKHGEGYMFFKNGCKYVGSFKKGSISGVGSYFKDEKLVVKGVWQKGELVKELSQNGMIEESDYDEDLEGNLFKEECHLRPELSKSAVFEIFKFHCAKKSNDNHRERDLRDSTEKFSRRSTKHQKSITGSSRSKNVENSVSPGKRRSNMINFEDILNLNNFK